MKITITTVPSASDMIDIVLSKLQRNTPTQVHPQFKVSRIRDFYMRKVKTCQEEFGERFKLILSQFPKLDDVHPFFSNLCNILYDRDHYKVALGQVNSIRQFIERCSKDYVRMLKYADGPFKCKHLKRAAIGRMCTAVKKLDKNLTYLEEIRQHLTRLPDIDPNQRTLMLSGFPNVGKTSFLNAVSKAAAEVQPYAFTTQSLYVGHFDYNLLRFQVIDTPGLLDRPLDRRNDIELQSITALAHIQAAVLFFIDLSETCGYSIEQQYGLFEQVKDIFADGRPLIVVLNKTDLQPFETLRPAAKQLLKQIKDTLPNTEFATTSCDTLEGIEDARNMACQMVMNIRLQQKVAKTSLESPVMERLRVAQPPPNPDRPPVIPESALREMKGVVDDENRPPLEIDLQELHGGAGAYQIDDRGMYKLENDEWRRDAVPEIYNGKNIADFVDSDILAKLQQLEEDEALQLAAGEGEVDMTIWKELDRQHGEFERKLKQAKLDRRMNRKPHDNHQLHRHGMHLKEAEERLTGLGIKLNDTFKQRGTERREVKHLQKMRKQHKAIALQDMKYPELKDAEEGQAPVAAIADAERLQIAKARLLRFTNPIHSGQLAPTSDHPDRMIVHRSLKPNKIQLGLHRRIDRVKAIKLKRMKEKDRNKDGRIGEADRRVDIKKPKHLFAGKRGIGKNTRR